jgi:hypothetical protein
MSAPELRREGRHWRFSYQGLECRLPNGKGVRYLAELLGHPGQERHVLELHALAEEKEPALSVAETADPLVTERARKAVSNRIRAAITRVSSKHLPLGAHLTERIKTGVFCQYRPWERQ